MGGKQSRPKPIIKIRPPKKPHIPQNKPVTPRTLEGAATQAKETTLYLTNLIKKNIYLIPSFYVFVLLIRFLLIDDTISHTFSYYIKFLLFFTIQYFGYIMLLIASIFSIETIILLTYDHLIKAIKRLLEKFKPHQLLKYYPINDYFWTHLLPRSITIAIVLFGIGCLFLLFFILIIPIAILLLGYTK
jgi:hypothetical protein